LTEDMTTHCEEAKVHLFELVDEKKLTFKMLPVESRVGTVKAHSIILEVTLTKQKNLFVLAKTDKNKIDKKLKSMPELEESSQDEEEEDKEDEEDEDEGRSKSAVRKPGKS